MLLADYCWFPDLVSLVLCFVSNIFFLVLLAVVVRIRILCFLVFLDGFSFFLRPRVTSPCAQKVVLVFFWYAVVLCWDLCFKENTRKPGIQAILAP